MKDWFSASELAGLPGVPGTSRGINKAAERESWRRQKRPKGKGREYHISSLPPETRAYLAANDQNGVLSSPEAQAGAVAGLSAKLVGKFQTAICRDSRQASLARLARLPARPRTRAEARLELLVQFDQFAKRAHLPISHALTSFCHLYNIGEMEVEAWIRDEVVHVHPATVQRWRSRLRKEGAAGLSGHYRARKGTSKIDTQEPLRTFCLGFIHDHPHASAQHVHEGLRARFTGQADVNLPSKRGVERWLSSWKQDNAQTFCAISNPDAWKGQYMAAQGSLSEDITRLNQVWEFDATPADLLLLDGRYQLTGAIDVYPRRPKLVVTKTSTAIALSSLLRRCLLDWGVPESAKTDNGKEYVGHHTTRVLQALCIEHIKCPPFQPWHKPHIERFFRTFSHHLVELLPGYIGHNVSDRQAIEARKSFADRLMTKGETVEISLTSAQLQMIADEWIEYLYMHRPHGSLDGKSPAEVIRDWRDPVQTIQDERALDLLLTDAPDNHGRRVVHKKGIRIKWPGEPRHHWYIAPELCDYVRQEVFVQYDPIGDMGRIYVSTEERFICVAECPELTGIDRQEHAAIAKQAQKAHILREKQTLREAAKAANTRGIAAEILEHHRRQVKNLVNFPQPEKSYESDGLHVAADGIRAADALDHGIERTLPEETEERLAEIKVLPVPERVLSDVDEKDRRFQEWERLDARMQTGGEVSEKDRQWHADYQDTAEFKSRWHMKHEFGKQHAE